LLLTMAFGMAAWLGPRYDALGGRGSGEGGVMEILLGDSRKLMASHFFVKADVYYHSGHYPTIFDPANQEDRDHLAVAITSQSSEHADEHGEDCPGGHSEYGFLAPPLDWIDRLSRNFYPSRHTHLRVGIDEREVLPWLRISASLDPKRPATYTVAAYWLRHRLGRPDVAEQFLREGWRANPDSYEILFELGRLQAENRKDDMRARNLWELALKKWHLQNDVLAEKDNFAAEQILANLAELEKRNGRPEQALDRLRELKPLSPHPEAIQRQIDDLNAGHPAPGAPGTR
jgi:tetratricopeptide (TPR) repeat protein